MPRASHSEVTVATKGLELQQNIITKQNKSNMHYITRDQTEKLADVNPVYNNNGNKQVARENNLASFS
jgi:hypothetical protein